MDTRQRKQTKDSMMKQLCMDISMGLNESNNLSISDSSEVSLSPFLLLLLSSQIFNRTFLYSVPVNVYNVHVYAN